MKKFILLLAVCAISFGILAQNIASADAYQKGKKTGSPLWKLDTSAKSNYRQVSQGDSQDVVIQKMGQPNIVTEMNDGSQVWVYTRVTKTANTRAAVTSTGNSMAMGPASFNTQIASNGFGRNMYTNAPVNQVMSTEPEDYYETKTIKIRFNQNGIVETFSESRN